MPNVLESATSLCQHLKAHGYQAFLAGGVVRDMLLGITATEIDIATNATPEIIDSLFPKTIDVGKSFGVMIVQYQGFQFEVSTFRKDLDYIDGRHPEGVTFTTPEEDAWRRDFTINGMFFDPETDTIYDYIGGKQDLAQGIIRAIGNPEKRFEEDKLRIIRGVRFSIRFDYPIEEATKKAMLHQAKEISSVSIERIWQELEKMQKDGTLVKGLLLLHELNILQNILPETSATYQELQTLLEPAKHFPEAPIICTILLLFPKSSLEKKIALCYRLKLSKKMIELTEFFHHSDLLFAEKPTNYQWAYFYAHPFSSLYIQCKKALLAPEMQENFLFENRERAEHLSIHIQRIQNRSPLVKAKDLTAKGIKPGKEMGKLLELAEQISINENISSIEEVIKHLPIN